MRYSCSHNREKTHPKDHAEQAGRALVKQHNDVQDCQFVTSPSLCHTNAPSFAMPAFTADRNAPLQLGSDCDVLLNMDGCAMPAKHPHLSPHIDRVLHPNLHVPQPLADPPPFLAIVVLLPRRKL